MDKKGLWIKKDPSKTPGGFFWKKAFSKKINQLPRNQMARGPL